MCGSKRKRKEIQFLCFFIFEFESLPIYKENVAYVFIGIHKVDYSLRHITGRESIVKAITVVLLVGFISLVLLIDKQRIKKGLELLSIYWFRIAFSFLALFILNVVSGFFGLYVPVNIVSGLVITVLGIPGFLSIFLIAIFL